MTDQSLPEPQNDTANTKGMKPATKLTLLFIPLLLLGSGWIFWQQLQETAAREVGIMTPPYGIISVRLTTEPFPPTTTGPAQMTLLMQAAGGSTVNLDRVTYSYRSVAGGEPIKKEAIQVARNAYRGALRFDSVGEWQVTIRIENGGHVNEGTITLPVEPAM